MTDPRYVPLAVATRNGHPECTFSGAVAVVDSAGQVIASAGDPSGYTFSRSSLKPFQALPFVQAGGIEQFGLDRPQTALLCASHSGEDRHVAAVSAMLERFGCDETHLRCGCHLPKRYQNGTPVPAGFKADQRHNNCSGKHAGFLGYCRMHDLPLDTYLDVQHPLQRAIAGTVAHLAELDETAFWSGTDGCNAPNLGLPLARLAWLWARFAGARSDGPEEARAMARLADAMIAHPAMYSGEARIDNTLTSLGNGRWVSKVGADGVRCVGVREPALGIAVKLADGHAVAADAVIVEVLRQLNLLDAAEYEAMRPWARPVIRNYVGTEVGAYQTAFALNFA